MSHKLSKTKPTKSGKSTYSTSQFTGSPNNTTSELSTTERSKLSTDPRRRGVLFITDTAPEKSFLRPASPSRALGFQPTAKPDKLTTASKHQSGHSVRSDNSDEYKYADPNYIKDTENETPFRGLKPLPRKHFPSTSRGQATSDLSTVSSHNWGRNSSNTIGTWDRRRS